MAPAFCISNVIAGKQLVYLLGISTKKEGNSNEGSVKILHEYGLILKFSLGALSKVLIVF